MGKWKSMVGKVTHVVLLRRQVARKRGGAEEEWFEEAEHPKVKVHRAQGTGR